MRRPNTGTFYLFLFLRFFSALFFAIGDGWGSFPFFVFLFDFQYLLGRPFWFCTFCDIAYFKNINEIFENFCSSAAWRYKKSTSDIHFQELEKVFDYLSNLFIFSLPTFQWKFQISRKLSILFSKILQPFYAQRCSCVHNGLKIVRPRLEKHSQISPKMTKKRLVLDFFLFSHNSLRLERPFIESSYTLQGLNMSNFIKIVWLVFQRVRKKKSSFTAHAALVDFQSWYSFRLQVQKVFQVYGTLANSHARLRTLTLPAFRALLKNGRLKDVGNLTTQEISMVFSRCKDPDGRLSFNSFKTKGTVDTLSYRLHLEAAPPWAVFEAILFTNNVKLFHVFCFCTNVFASVVFFRRYVFKGIQIICFFSLNHGMKLKKIWYWK